MTKKHTINIMRNEILGGSKEIWDIYSQILKIVNLNPKEKILDAGCGEGLLMNHFQGENVKGIDLNPENIKKAMTKGYKEVLEGDLTKLPFKNGEFDKTICMEVVQFVDNQRKMFQELLRVTKKEIILTSPNHNFSSIRTLFKLGRSNFIKGLQDKKHFFVNQYLFERLANENDLKLEMKYLSRSFGFIRNLRFLGNLLAGEIVGIFLVKEPKEQIK